MLSQKQAKVLGNREELANRILKATKEGDLEFIKMLFFAGLKNLGDYKNIEGRNIGHIVFTI